MIIKPKSEKQTQHRDRMKARRDAQTARKVTYRKIQVSCYDPREEDKKHSAWRAAMRRLASNLKLVLS